MRLPLALALVALSALPARAEDLESVAAKAKLTPAQAIKVAQGGHSGTAQEIELEVRNSRPVYVIEFDDDRKVTVDAVTGQVVPSKRKEAK